MQNSKKILLSIYEEQVAGLFSYGCKFTADRELVKDCIHDVFVKLYEKEDISSIQNLKFYLLRSLKNRLLDALSATGLKATDEIMFTYAQEPSDEDHFITDEKNRQLKEYVEKVFENLTSKQKEAVYLYYIEELDYAEIARMLGMEHQSVKNTVHRALVRLREKLGDKPPPFLVFYLLAVSR